MPGLPKYTETGPMISGDYVKSQVGFSPTTSVSVSVCTSLSVSLSLSVSVSVSTGVSVSLNLRVGLSLNLRVGLSLNLRVGLTLTLILILTPTFTLNQARIGAIKDGQLLRVIKYMPQEGKDAEFKALLEQMSVDNETKDLAGSTMYSGAFTEDGGVITAMMFESEDDLKAYKEGLRSNYMDQLKGCIKMPAAVDDVTTSAFAVQKGF